ncbi:hypothetical protein G4B88_017782, partial [Cannabis sativa]
MSHGSSRTRRSLNYQVEEDAEMIFKEVGMDECENIADKEVEDLTEAEFEGIAEAECEMAEVELVQPRKMTNTSKNENQNENNGTPEDANVNKINSVKKTRGRTTLANLTKRNNDLRKINWNEKGQPVGTNSVQFSSYVGALVREVAPYTISDWRKMSPIMKDILWASIQVALQAQYDLYDDWQKKMCFEMMASLWRSGKSRLVKELNDAKNESERLAMKPDCIKSDAEWRSFVTQKTSKEHMAIRAKFQERRKKVVPHTLSRRGYARTIDDMKKDTKEGKVSRIEAFRRAHTKKNGEPINPTASEVFVSTYQLIFIITLVFYNCTSALLIHIQGELDNIIREDPNSEITENIEEDALTKLFGDPKSGRLIGQGRGITRSKLNGGKATPSEGQSLNATQSNNNPSPNSVGLKKDHNFTEAMNACYMLDWSDTIVAEGRWISSDPNIEIHGLPLDQNLCDYGLMLLLSQVLIYFVLTMRCLRYKKLLVPQLHDLLKRLFQENIRLDFAASMLMLQVKCEWAFNFEGIL